MLRSKVLPLLLPLPLQLGLPLESLLQKQVLMHCFVVCIICFKHDLALVPRLYAPIAPLL